MRKRKEKNRRETKAERSRDKSVKAEEYLDILAGQIRCKMAREAVLDEVRAHLEDQTRAFLSEGAERSEAERLAVREMGDPVEVGNELDRIHRPKMPWEMLGLIAVLTIVGYAAQYFWGQKIYEAAGPDMNGYGNLFRQFFFGAAGFAVMVGVCFIDYTRIARQADKVLAALLGFCALGLAFSGVSVNGARRWIDCGPVSVNVLLLLLLTVPLYAAVLYKYRGEGKRAVIKAALWMLPGGLLAVSCSGIWMAAVLLLTCAAVFSVAVYRGWFRVSVKMTLAATGAAAALLPLGAAVFIWFSGAEYQRDRMAGLLGRAEGISYGAAFVRKLLEGSRIVGEGKNLPDLSCMPEAGEITLAGIAGYYGILAAAAVAAMLIFLFLRFLHISIRQKNQLGMLMGTGCAVVFLLQVLLYVLNNLGIVWFGNYCPFLQAGGSGTVVSYILLGILLSICRHRNTAPERIRVTLQIPREKTE